MWSSLAPWICECLHIWSAQLDLGTSSSRLKLALRQLECLCSLAQIDNQPKKVHICKESFLFHYHYKLSYAQQSPTPNMFSWSLHHWTCFFQDHYHDTLLKLLLRMKKRAVTGPTPLAVHTSEVIMRQQKNVWCTKASGRQQFKSSKCTVTQATFELLGFCNSPSAYFDSCFWPKKNLS